MERQEQLPMLSVKPPYLNDMAQTSESSVSPMTRSPRSQSPSGKANLAGETNRDVQTRVTSPLRTEQKANGLLGGVGMQNGEALRPQHPGSIKADTSSTEPTSFPFDAAPGTVGESPTNELAGVYGRVHPSGEDADAPADLAGPLPGQLSRRATQEVGTTTPQGRRSVQFARSDALENAIPSHSRQQSGDAENGEILAKEKPGTSLMSKLKALAAPMSIQSHGRTLSGWTIGDSTMDDAIASGPASPTYDRNEHRWLGSHDEGSELDADADAEESGTEAVTAGPSRPARKRRKSRRLPDGGPQTAPTTPKMTNALPFSRDSPSTTPTSTYKPSFLPRRATMTDIPEHQRQGVSEDEGRARMDKEGAWRSRSGFLHGARGLSHVGTRRPEGDDTPDSRRPGNLRRFTGFAHRSDASPSTWRQRTERTSTISAQKWRQIKAGLKMLGQKRKEELRVDHAKSAELIAELLAGAPAALFFASMFQRDEHGHRRVPVLLEQLKIRITDSQRVTNRGGDRHVVFRIELEYGSGLTRMKWVINRTLRDFAALHLRYKSQGVKDTLSRAEDPRHKMPRFPKSAFPYLRGVRGLADDDEDDEDEGAGEASGHDGEASGTDRPRKTSRHRSSFAFARRKSSLSGPQMTGANTDASGRAGSATRGTGGLPRETYAERQRRRLETYLREMITWLIFRPDSNRLCKFLELSALGVRLAAEGGYHGKEGYLVIQSGKGMDFRRRLTPTLIKTRHRPKWFLVRHSYIACVDSPEEMNIYDVFLVDPDFTIEPRKKRLRDQDSQEIAEKELKSASRPTYHPLRIRNSERRTKLLAKNDRQLQQFEESIRFMQINTEWARKHRFDSFAPLRHNVWAQWLVDGRDYMWNVSRALSMARDVIYIHDWWLSPELYLRRPPAISQKWRLDRVLQRKAQEGVKIFVIMYRNINSAIPIDSEYSKFSLLDLHPNVFVQRSPNQFRQNTFFWAHHEKICIVDHTVAFCGGVDLCFGRWDTPTHLLTDDKLTGFELNDVPKDADHCQLWPGKDYSSPRVQDFYALDKPYEEMYDRSKVPRMPWHDIGMQIVGQPARDLSRHFVQRWNYILRQRKPSRPTPFLLPPPDFNPAELEALGLDGTCEIQILRSATEWSLGTQGKTEHSIMNAYVKLIEKSEHFIYIENQFFISSCEVEGSKIQNLIGDALVERIIRANANNEDWRCVIVIPLMPGFQSTVDSPEGSSIRLIMMCQYRSICRGPTSIFGRLSAAGIEPEDYIEFYSLRNWGKIGPNKGLTTEQLYIHAKIMIVDDRFAIIGSANINERSLLGSRDSEVAAIVQDREMLWSYMNGEPYRVGKFPHTLRMRLMREHLGIDVDNLQEDESHKGRHHHGMEQSDDEPSSSANSSPATDKVTQRRLNEVRHQAQDDLIARSEMLHSFNHDADWEAENNPNLKTNKKLTTDPRVIGNVAHEKDVRGEGADHMLDHLTKAHDADGRDSMIDPEGREILIADIAPEGRGTLSTPKKDKRKRAVSDVAGDRKPGFDGLPPTLPRMDTRTAGLTQLSQLPALPIGDDTDIGGPPLLRTFSAASAENLNPLLANMRRPIVTQDCMRDPLNDAFSLDTWHKVAENNTKLFRQVFRCQPDNEVTDWREYREYTAFSERFAESQGLARSKERKQQEASTRTGPPGHAGFGGAALAPNKAETASEKMVEKIPSKGSAASNSQQTEKLRTKDKLPGRLSPSSADGEVFDEKAAAKAEDDAATADRILTSSVNGDGTSLNEKVDGTADLKRERTVTYSEPPSTGIGKVIGRNKSTRKGSRARGSTRSSTRAFHASDEDVMLSKEDAEQLLNLVQGHLVVFPYDWLEKEERDAKWLYTVDQLAPLEIYT